MDLATNYLGLVLKNPLIASSSPLNLELANIRMLEDYGAAAVVLPSMFEEQIEREAAEVERFTTAGVDSFAEALSYLPSVAACNAGAERYLDVIRRARAAVDIPLIASLNGITDSGWIEYARLVEEAGANAVELNIYFIPTDVEQGGREVEQRYIAILQAVKDVVDIPVSVKLSPYFSAAANFICELDSFGADGFVLFNRFYEPDIDLASLRLRHDLELSTPADIRLPLLWISVLSGKIRASLAASTGVESSDEIVKYLLAGADVVMTTSALLRHGVGHISTLLQGLVHWLDARNIATVGAIRGRMNGRNINDPTTFERANYIQILQSWRA